LAHPTALQTRYVGDSQYGSVIEVDQRPTGLASSGAAPLGIKWHRFPKNAIFVFKTTQRVKFLRSVSISRYIVTQNHPNAISSDDSRSFVGRRRVSQAPQTVSQDCLIFVPEVSCSTNVAHKYRGKISRLPKANVRVPCLRRDDDAMGGCFGRFRLEKISKITYGDHVATCPAKGQKRT
jgi:hypothetical protein